MTAFLYRISPNSSGEGEQRRHGLKLLKTTRTPSPLIGPLPESSLGRTTLELPHTQFDRNHRAIQITSYRDAQRTGMAISEIVIVPLVSGAAGLSDATRSDALLPLALATAMETAMEEPTQSPIETVPFLYREAPPLSSALFIGKLLQRLNQSQKGTGQPLLQSVAGGLLQAATGQPGQPGGTAAQIGQLVGSVLNQAIAPSGQPNPLLQTVGQVAGEFLQGATGQPAQPGQAGLANQIGQLTGALVGSVLQGAGSQSPVNPQNMMLQPQIGNGAGNSSGAAQLPATSPLLSPGQTYAPPGSAAPLTESAPQSGTAQSLSYGAPARRAVGWPPGSPPPRPSAAQPSATRPFAEAQSRSPYAEGMAAPAVAALLTNPQVMETLAQVAPQITGQLAGILQQALSPETINAIGANLPTNKLISVISDGIKEASRMQMEARKQDIDHLEKITQVQLQGDLADNQFLLQHAQMNQSMSLELAGATTALTYQRIDSVRLDFSDRVSLMLGGRSRLLYRPDQDWAFPLTLQTPRPIAQATLQLLVKHATTLEILIEAKFPVEQAAAGPLPVVPRLARERLTVLQPNEDYLVCVALVWSGKPRGGRAKTQIGTCMSQLITILGDYAFDRLEGEAPVVPLNDVEKYRAYWHKIWQTDLSKHLRRVELDCRYYYALERDRSENARMETLLKLDEKQGAEQTGQLKTGLILTPDRLNDLLTQISSHPRLNDAELAALKTVEFKNQFTHAARATVKFKGKAGNTVALWIYPEMKVQRLVLKQATKTNDHGLVLEMSEHPVHFPMLAQVHFIGVST